ncbi:LuxR family transcriptional regulator [Azospirillum thiophilum]|uniref:LuxR family transcriptional regulator n=1 Tax=Azospirillum thiophilum TaxID=528244 RepID=A0AAC9EYF8_9PROT|nr:response regulator [Azospirillum thiophilum]ALG74604.1 LuxR family transcriptional regulator [Azospirillum thiophilum]KJR61779.1 LuxR family transcriptional regulator [Azospirillum thiophilum]
MTTDTPAAPVAPVAFVVDDDEAVRDALALHLELAGLAVRCCGSAAEFLAAASPVQPGCAILDIRMPGMDGLDLQQEMIRRGLTLPVIVITGHGDVTAAVRAFRAGAVDFLQKPFDEDLLIERVQEAFGRDLAARRADVETAEIRSRLTLLSPRELEVMDLVAQGLPNKTIAHRLAIGIRTVETHRARVLEKMEARNAPELARMRMLLGDRGD